jgi:RNA recognition motif-containing protein
VLALGVLLVTCSLSCEVVFRGKRSSGYGFVAYKNNEDAEKAVEALNKRGASCPYASAGPVVQTK